MRNTPKFLQHLWTVLLLLCLCCLIALFPVPAHAALSTFSYDESGRLSGMNDSGGAAEFNYDSQGNLLSVQRNATGAPMILEFTPNRGPVGTQVNIIGRGFSATATSNIVKFNGVVANVVSAGTTSLVVQVPSGATTGKISVTVGTLTDTSTQDFEVAAVVGLPTITNFTPAVGNPDTAVTITGTNFDTTPSGTRVEFNGTIATVTAISATSVTALAPKGVTTGPIRIITPAGQVNTASNFVAVPSDINGADIVSQKLLTVGGATQTLTITPAGKIGLYYFDGNANQVLTLNIASLTTSPVASVNYRLYTAQNQQIGTGSISTSNPFIHFPVLPQNGRYYLYFLPGSSTATISASLNTDVAIMLDSGNVAVNANIVGQSKRFYFSAIAGDRIDLTLTGLTHAPTNDGISSIYVDAPNGGALANISCAIASSDCVLHLYISQSGTYPIRFVPPSNRTATGNLWVSKAISGSLVKGSAQTINLTRAGQSAAYSFEGGAMMSTLLRLSSLVTSPANQKVDLKIYRADNNAEVASTSGQTSTGDIFFGVPFLPVTGTYRIVVSPQTSATSSFKLTWAPPADWTLDSPAKPLATTVAGQTAVYAFNVTDGQSFSIALNNVVHAPTNDGATELRIYNESQTLITSQTCATSTGACNAYVINPRAGQYSVRITPPSNRTLKADAWLSSAVNVATGQTTSIARPGQLGIYSFGGTTGQAINLRLSQLTTSPVDQTISARVFRADTGEQISLSTGRTSTGDISVNIPSLPAYTTYRLVMSPSYAATMSFRLDPAGGLSLGGAAVPVSNTTAGTTLSYQFNANAGESFTVALSDLAYTSAGSSAILSVQDPSGVYGYSDDCVSGGCNVSIVSAPTSGTYTIQLVNDRTFTAKLWLSTSLKPTLVDNTSLDISLTRPGQSALFKVKGNATYGLKVQVTNLVSNPSAKPFIMRLFRTDTMYRMVEKPVATSGMTQIYLTSLPYTGDYLVEVNALEDSTGSFTIINIPQ